MKPLPAFDPRDGVTYVTLEPGDFGFALPRMGRTT